jgi:tRNA nucleotidyltransferase (CCA-adding enzyme)
MKVITTHVGADFDGFAAMLGLLKLHPDARLVFPGSKEPVVRKFLRETGLELPEIAPRDLPQIGHLILVDVAREDRLGPLANVLQQSPRPTIEVYDHHPGGSATIPADRLHVYPYGSTTTIVVLEMMQAARGETPPLTTLEASVLLAGIYEDTASFTSTGTTEEDFRAAQFLLQQGAEVGLVNRFLSHGLLPEHVAFFNRLVSHCEQISLEGHNIVLSPFRWHVFVPEAAYLVHRLMDLEPIDVFFALILMENRVHVIARSRLADVDAGEITAQLGGGGHKMAAAAVLKGVTLIEAREKLLSVLHQTLKRSEKAVDLMKPNIITLESGKTIAEAAELMNSYRINALVVTDKEKKVAGTISRQIVDGAIFHGLKDRPVDEYMVTDLPLVDPDTPVAEILEQMLSGRTRFVLVGKHAADVRGIITRMDLFRLHYELTTPSPALRRGKRSENLSAMLKKRLPEFVHQMIQQSGEIAEEIGCRVYLVGGIVRDLMLHRENTDVDLVVEGDGIHFAEAFAEKHGCTVAAHRRFGTAKLVFPDRFKIDVATARTESYHAPAALPQVLGGILRQDLYRRDFTINTLAVDLSPRQFGVLIDYFGGWDDLHQGIIRVLHSLSFVDDPTRTLRAIRFATRFNFRISKDTQRLMESAVESRILQRLSGKRFWTELRNLLQEEHPIPSLRMMHEFRLLQFIHPLIALDTFLLDLLYQIQSVLAWFQLNFLREKPVNWLLYLMALLEKLDRSERIEIGRRFQLTSGIQETLKSYKTAAKDIRARLLSRDSLKPSGLYFSLREYSLEVLLYAMARSSEETLRQQVATYLRDLRGIQLHIKGDDVLKLGFPEGPGVKEILAEVLKARLDGEVLSREQQIRFASEVMKRHKPPV